MISRPALNAEDFVQESASRFRVHRRVYTDPAVFDLGMRRIFETTWVYIGHETEVARAGDYKTTFLGRHPVIMARKPDDNGISVLFNRCRHRGATVCQQEGGNANYFRCAYHGWVYNNSGDLVGVTFEEGYAPSFDKSQLGLVRVPRVDQYQGFVFASLSAQGPGLEEHLGNAKPYIDAFAAQGPQGIELTSGVQKFAFQGNWKLQLENTTDRYHASFLHASAFQIMERRTGRDIMAGFNPDALKVWDLGAGHSVCELVSGGGLGSSGGNVSGYSGMRGPGFNINVFPNLALLFNQVRHILPRAVDRTEVRLYLTRLKDVPPEVNAARIREHESFYGPAGFGAPDDWEIFNRVNSGLQAEDVDWVLMSRGVGREETDGEGRRWNRDLEEASARALYRHWLRLMAEG